MFVAPATPSHFTSNTKITSHFTCAEGLRQARAILKKRKPRKQLATTKPDEPLPGPSAPERQAIERATLRVEARSPRVRVKCSAGENGVLKVVGGAHSDHAGWLARLQDAFGTSGTDFALAQLNRLITLCRDADGKIDNVKLNSLLAMIEGALPANEVQAALAVQMVMTHTAVQTVLQRALRADQIPQFESASHSAVKLLRTFAMQAETLAKLQRGGEQVVKVVHVHPGAQAIVGNVVSGSAGSSLGGGVSDENWNQPHAKGELPAPGFVPLREVRSQDAEREAVPCTGRQREAAVPDARRRAGQRCAAR